MLGLELMRVEWLVLRQTNLSFKKQIWNMLRRKIDFLKQSEFKTETELSDYAVFFGSLTYFLTSAGLALSGHVSADVAPYLAASNGLAMFYGQYRIGIKPLRQWIKNSELRRQLAKRLGHKSRDNQYQKC